VTVIRIRRDGAVNQITQLDQARIRELWSDPLLRFSNVLDGIFHEAVVVTESDSDARFYAAVADVLFAEDLAGTHKPHVMFTDGGGKARLPLVVKSLRLLGVPVKTVADFDIFNDEHPLAELVEAAGGKWADFEGDWRTVKNAVDSKKPELSTEEVSQQISAILTATKEKNFPVQAKRNIEQILRKSSAWAHAKTVGKTFVPSGGATQACERLLNRLRSSGIFVVEVGELEGFIRSIGGHATAWVAEAIQRNLKNDPELEGARKFARDIFRADTTTSASAAQQGVAALVGSASKKNRD
jgi:hypothetical protein